MINKYKSIFLGLIPLLASFFFLRTNGLAHREFENPKEESFYQEQYKENENPDDFGIGFVNVAYFCLSIGLAFAKLISGRLYPVMVGDILFLILAFGAFGVLVDISKTSDIQKSIFGNGDWTPVTTYLPITVGVCAFLSELVRKILHKRKGNIRATAV